MIAISKETIINFAVITGIVLFEIARVLWIGC